MSRSTRTTDATARLDDEPEEEATVIQAIDRAAKVLELLQGARHLGITDLSLALGLPPSTVHGIVKSLREHGLVAKERGGQRYMLGPTLLRLSNVYLDTLDVRARAMRWTQELARRTNLPVRLGAPHFHEVLVIHHDLRPDDSQQMLETGVAIPAHASAMGKVLLAHDLGFQRTVFERPLRSLTGDTITDIARLTLELPAIAERGSASETDEAVLGESSIAAPVADASNDIVAAVAVVMPTSHAPASDAVLNALRETARNISRELGATSWPPRVAPADD
ncbi:IclR family transcriptional regulator [Microbacterium sp. 22215]|uniref:IclR family transcriptional regulator n=1 Tax=Microbacterium sp. 22215 TaxID=3453893 RepID=UPI003F83B875